MAAALAVALALYGLVFFVVLDLPVVGTPTFRIDYYATTITRGDEASDFIAALLYSRPGSAIFQSVQAALAIAFLDGEARYITYLIQHVGIFVGFFATLRVLESILRVRLSLVAIISAWLMYLSTYAVLEGVYKLETIVGTLTTIFGALSLYMLARWQEDGRTRNAVASLALYAAAIFSKEDYILPQILLLGWYLTANPPTSLENRRYWKMLAAFVAIVAGFLVFNMLLTTSRSFISPEADASSPYYMTLAPASMLKSAMYYWTATGYGAKAIAAGYAACSLIALVHRRYWKETILVALIVFGLMGPYLIMPNHNYTYYGQKWLVWQALAVVATIQIAVARRRALVGALSLLACAAIVVPTASGYVDRTDRYYHMGRFIRGSFDVSRNMLASLEANREQLNRQQVVAVLGIGPAQLQHSPWQGNGETAFFLTGDLGLETAWVLYTREFSNAYRASADNPRLVVKNIEAFDSGTEPMVLAFDADGHGSLVARHALPDRVQRLASSTLPLQLWTADGANVSVEPSAFEGCTTKGEVAVEWDFSSIQGVGLIDVWVGEGEDRKRWVSGRPIGRSTTGRWVGAGFLFTFTDRETGTELARLRLGGPGHCGQ